MSRSGSTPTTRPRSTPPAGPGSSAWARDPRVVAIGETGLDYDRVFSPIPDQLANLRRNLALALATGKPAILHCRSGAGPARRPGFPRAELRAAGVGGGEWAATFGDRPPAVIHSFSGPLDYAEECSSSACDQLLRLVFRHGEESSAEAVTAVPDDRLLVETDSPFLAPPGAPRSRNEPEWVRVTAAWAAEQRNTTIEALGGGLIDAYDRTFRHLRG